MATVFMKWLERSPSDYERGINLITFGKSAEINATIASDLINPEEHVLEIGCGTGQLTCLMAKKGACIYAIDSSAAMISETDARIKANNLEERVTLYFEEVFQIANLFAPSSFDVIVSKLVLSELSNERLDQILFLCSHLLKPYGRLIIADEVIPHKIFLRLVYYFIRYPMALLTWLLTRTTTYALKKFPQSLKKAGFKSQIICSYLWGSLVLFQAIRSADSTYKTTIQSSIVKGRLSGKFTLKSILIELWAVFFRIIPPYPRISPGIYKVGEPTQDSPILVTGNFALTIQRLVRAIDGRLDVWVLAVDSAGINNWCAAGGGFFTAGKIINQMRASNVEDLVTHRQLILPQLSANGVDGWKIRRDTGWKVLWGPVRASDIPDYIKNKATKTDSMRQVTFPLKDRLEMVCVTLGFYGLLVLLPVWIFWRHLFNPLGISLVSISLFYAIVQPCLPGKDGLYKSVPLSIISLLVFYLVTWKFYPLDTLHLFYWTLGLIGVSVFTAAEMQGMSPKMRGEQANWGFEILIAAILFLLYWIVPRIATWR